MQPRSSTVLGLVLILILIIGLLVNSQFFRRGDGSSSKDAQQLRGYELVKEKRIQRAKERKLKMQVTIPFSEHLPQLLQPDARPKVMMNTQLGTLVFELRPDAAPKTVENFLRLVNMNFFSQPGASLYRGEYLPNRFCLQGGGWPRKPSPLPPVPLEYKLPNIKYAVSMARTSDPNSATSEFSIMLADNSKWLGPGASEKHGYAVFAHIVGGFDVIEKAAKRPVKKQSGLSYFVEPIPIYGASIYDRDHDA